MIGDIGPFSLSAAAGADDNGLGYRVIVKIAH
ncbi:hypothetical protein ABIA32_002823 [Streptacidiphilus sp. MAP12-20]